MTREPYGPTPSGRPLTLEIGCRTDPDSLNGPVHWLTIHPDWSIEVPHDPELEGLAEALGGWSSCMTAVEPATRAVSQMIGQFLRTETPPLRRLQKTGAWFVNDDAPGCCEFTQFTDVTSAARHIYSARHIAAKFQADEHTTSTILRAVTRAWKHWPLPATSNDLERRIQHGRKGLLELWRAGIHPADVSAAVALASDVQEPLSTGYVIQIVHNPTAAFTHLDTLSTRPTAEWADWVATHGGSYSDASTGDVVQLLKLGLSQSDIQTALDAEIDLITVHMMVRTSGVRPSAATAWLCSWAAVGCEPSSRHWDTLVEHNAATRRPSRSAINQLVRDARPWWPDADRTELAVMLAVIGSNSEVIYCVQRGLRSANR